MNCPLPMIWCAIGLHATSPHAAPSSTVTASPAAPASPAPAPAPAPTPSPAPPSHTPSYSVNSTCCFGQNGSPQAGTKAATIGFTALGIASVAHAIATGHATAVGAGSSTGHGGH